MHLTFALGQFLRTFLFGSHSKSFIFSPSSDNNRIIHQRNITINLVSILTKFSLFNCGMGRIVHLLRFWYKTRPRKMHLLHFWYMSFAERYYCQNFLKNQGKSIFSPSLVSIFLLYLKTAVCFYSSKKKKKRVALFDSPGFHFSAEVLSLLSF